jgi:hypothetical protein
MYFFSNSPVLQRDSESDPARETNHHGISQVTFDESRLSRASIAHKDEPGKDVGTTVRNRGSFQNSVPARQTPGAWHGEAFHPSRLT